MPRRLLAVLVLPLALGGCFLPWWRGRPAADSVPGTAVYVERCEICHAERPGRQYAESLHSAKGIRCGQCHTAGNHPDFAQPVRDAKCGGCHEPHLQQTLASKHFATRIQQPLDSDRPARIALRREGFVSGAAGERKFVGDADSELGGRLCAACHYDEHRLGLRVVQRADFCSSCHARRENHFPGDASTNRCVTCHVRVGESVTGQVVNTHRFAVPGTQGTGQ